MAFKVGPTPDACATCGDHFWDCHACGCATCACGHTCLMDGEEDVLDLLDNYLEDYEIPEAIKEKGRK